jgi:hypothetical protein
VPLAARGIPMGVTQQHGHPNLERQSLAHFVKLARLGFVFRVPTGKLAGRIRPHVFVYSSTPGCRSNHSRSDLDTRKVSIPRLNSVMAPIVYSPLNGTEAMLRMEVQICLITQRTTAMLALGE